MANKVIKLSKGFDIKIKGKAEKILDKQFQSATFAINPTDFRVLSPLPKLFIKEKEEVKAGDGLFYDAAHPEIIYASPVSGEIVAIKRGAKRAITEIVILADSQIKFKEFSKANPKDLTREKIIEALTQSGCWAFFRQRPFAITANPKDKPKAIFISAFDNAPLAPDYDFIIHGQGNEFQTGLDALAKLTDGKVHLNLNADEKPSGVFENSKNVQINLFSGVHPSSSVGVQIHHIDPIRKGDIVWYLNPQDVLTIGRLFCEGKYDTERIFAIAGPEVKKPRYFRSYIGANIENIIKDNLASDNVRIISGNVLTGKKMDAKGHIGFYDNLVTVIEEGNQYEFLGWLIPAYSKPSMSRTFLSWLAPNKEYKVNTNTHGEDRAYVMTGQYEKVVPMDIYPVQLIKSILYKDLDQMEGLGIYEVAEEDLALCEFVCTSKMEVQKILREGLDLVMEEC